MCQYDPDCKVEVHPYGEVCPLFERKRKRRERLDLVVVILAVIAAVIVVVASLIGYL
jgi:hypothetical protein